MLASNQTADGSGLGQSILGLAVTHAPIEVGKFFFLDPQAPEGKSNDFLGSNWSPAHSGNCQQPPALERPRAQTDEVRTGPTRFWKLQKDNFPTSGG